MDAVWSMGFEGLPMKFATSNGTAKGRARSIRGLLAAIFLLSLFKTQYSTCLAEAQDTDGESPTIGSIDEYVHRQSPRGGYSIPELSLEVLNGTGQLDGALVTGAVVVRAYPGGPAAQAGLVNEWHGTQSALLGAFMLGSFFFPPAFLGAVVVSQSQIGEAHDTIIAVDSERVESVEQLENAVAVARTGQIVYFTVVRGGSRRQIRVFWSQTGAEAPPVVQLP